MWVWLQIQGSWVRSRRGPILSWRLIMKYFLWSFFSFCWIISRRIVVSYMRKYVHEVLVNCLFKFAQEKGVVRWTDHPAMTIAGLENSTRPLIFTSASGCRASENFDISRENQFFPINANIFLWCRASGYFQIFWALHSCWHWDVKQQNKQTFNVSVTAKWTLTCRRILFQ